MTTCSNSCNSNRLNHGIGGGQCGTFTLGPAEHAVGGRKTTVTLPVPAQVRCCKEECAHTKHFLFASLVSQH
jgi:hypothetical protein